LIFSMLLDLRGLNCSLPVMRTRKMLCLLAQRDRLTVECTDPLAVIDIPRLPHETGDTLECREAAKGLFFICHMKRGEACSNFFAGGPPMRRDPGAVSLLRLYHLETTPGDGVTNEQMLTFLWDLQAYAPPRHFR
jgi:tRNA 2-thiouridine synthesizing protein A